MKIINKERASGKTTQLIYTSATTGFRIITPNAHMASNIAKMAKQMGFDIPTPLSDVEYRSDPHLSHNHDPILIDECLEIIAEVLELYFDAPVVAATMSVPMEKKKEEENDNS